MLHLFELDDAARIRGTGRRSLNLRECREIRPQEQLTLNRRIHRARVKYEWAGFQTSPIPALQEERAMEARRQAARVMMLDFLEGRDDLDFYQEL